MQWLEQAADDGFPNHPLFASDPELAGLRKEPRFIALLGRLKSDMDRLQRVTESQGPRAAQPR